jgi:hypothetical protein
MTLTVSLHLAEIARLEHEQKKHADAWLAGNNDAAGSYHAAGYSIGQHRSQLAEAMEEERASVRPQVWDVISVRPNGNPGVQEDHLFLTIREKGNLTTIALISS